MKNKNKSFYITFISLIAALGGLLFGFDTAVISGAEQALQVYFIDSLGLSSLIHGLTISSALIGCIIGGLFSGILSNRMGRKKSLILAAILFFISALGSAYPEFLFFTKDEPTMGLLIMFNVYRILGGIGVGLASGLSPLYIAEIAPATIRGKLVTVNNLAIIIGMLVVYFVNWSIAHGKTIDWINSVGWRYMFASEMIPAFLFFILLFFVPETPRFLASRNKDEEAFKILEKINGSKEIAREILLEINKSTDTVSRKIFSYGKSVIIIGILLSIFQQFVGINVVLYYAPRIFAELGADQNSSMIQTVVMGIVNVLFVLIAVQTVDKWGRKPLLITGSIGMAIGMLGVATLSFYNIIGLATLVFILVYTACYMVSWGPITWVLLSEIFPNNIRGQAMAIAVAAQWTANLLISSTFPSMIEISGALTYGFYGVMSILSIIFVLKMVPETKGKSLEELEVIWKNDEKDNYDFEKREIV
jgi:SP family xylose:H+ symportor-like MFS transporter